MPADEPNRRRLTITWSEHKRDARDAHVLSVLGRPSCLRQRRDQGGWKSGREGDK